MRSRNSLNGTARNRGSRSARPSSSVIGSAWSLGIWHLDYGGTPPVSGCGRIMRHTTRSVLRPFSYHCGLRCGNFSMPFRVSVRVRDKSSTRIPSRCCRFAIEERCTADAATPARYKNGGGHQTIWKNLGGPVILRFECKRVGGRQPARFPPMPIPGLIVPGLPG